jgi:hypothetical protein
MKKKIFVRAPALSATGYGEQSRFALRALKSREDLFDVYIQPIPWGQSGWVWQDNELRQWMDKRIAETQILLTEKKAITRHIVANHNPQRVSKTCANQHRLHSRHRNRPSGSNLASKRK